MMVWKMIFLFNWVIFRFYVNLPGCNLCFQRGSEGVSEAIGGQWFLLIWNWSYRGPIQAWRHAGRTSFILERMWAFQKTKKKHIRFQVFSNASNNIHVNWESTCMTTIWENVSIWNAMNLPGWSLLYQNLIFVEPKLLHFEWTSQQFSTKHAEAIERFVFTPLKKARRRKNGRPILGKTLSGWKKWRGRRKSTPAWMSRWKCWDQRLGSVGCNPNIHHLLSRLYPFDPNHSLASCDIQVHSLNLTVRSCQEDFSKMESWFPTIHFQVCVSFRESIHWMCWIHI